jgi:hypothetical protein
MWGPRNGPHAPRVARKRPGGAVTLLDPQGWLGSAPAEPWRSSIRVVRDLPQA